MFYIVQSSYFLHEFQTLNLLLSITRLWSHLILARVCMEEIPDSRLLILLLLKYSQATSEPGTGKFSMILGLAPSIM